MSEMWDDHTAKKIKETWGTPTPCVPSAVPCYANYWRKFPDEKPLANQICIVAAGPGRVAQHVALRWDEYDEEFIYAVEDTFDPFPTEEATHWMPWPDDPEA